MLPRHRHLDEGLPPSPDFIHFEELEDGAASVRPAVLRRGRHLAAVAAAADAARRPRPSRLGPAALLGRPERW